MTKFPPPIQRLINEFNKLPGIGPKVAQRFVFHLLKQPTQKTKDLVSALKDLPASIRACQECNIFAESNPCHICDDKKRDRKLICVVAESHDVATIEGTKEYSGLYHILNGLVNPLADITPESLNVNELVKRVTKSRPEVKEIILALDQTTEGETTELYIKKTLKNLPVKITKLARGLPVGADLEYADELTLTNALKSRQEL